MQNTMRIDIGISLHFINQELPIKLKIQRANYKKIVIQATKEIS